MLNDSIYNDITERCGGRARVGVVCADGEARAVIFSDFVGAEQSGLTFCDGAEDCNAAVLVDGGAPGQTAALADGLRKKGLPFVIVTASDDSALSSECGAPAVRADVSALSSAGFDGVMRALLFAFPVAAIDVIIPSWVRALPAENSAVAELCAAVRAAAPSVNTMADCPALSELLAHSDNWQPDVSLEIFPASGRAVVRAKIKDGAFFSMLSETAGEDISDESSLMSFVVTASQARKNYDKVKDALECAKVTGYGVVRPSDDDLSLEKPVVVRQGSNVGVKLKATAPSYHIVKVDVCGEVSPIMGSAAQSEGMVGEIMNGFESDPQAMWNTNLFGKSLRTMVQEGLAGKVNSMQDDTRAKMRKAITRIVNEGKGGVICILL